MAMTLDTAIKFTAKLEGSGLDQLKRNLQGLSQQSTVSKRSLDQLYTATQKLGAASGNTIAGLQRTVGSLKALRDNAEFGSRSFKLLTRDIEAAEARLRRFQGAAGSAGGISRGQALLAGVAGGIAAQVAGAAAGAAGAGIRGITQVGLDAESARVRLRALANEFGEYNQAQAAAARIAQTLRLSTTEAEQGFASLYASLRPTGITIAELEKAFIGFTAAARNSGATAQETSNALIQLKQGLASGTLQGEELRSIREQAPLVAQAIAKELGVTIGELKDLAAEGKVTTDVVLRALGKLNDTQLGKLNEQFDTGQQALKDFRVASEELGKSLARIFGPSAVSLLRTFTGAVRDAADVLGGITGEGEAGRRMQLRQQAQQQAARETQDRFGIFNFQQGSKNQFFLERQQQIYQDLLKADQQRQQQDKANADQLAAQTQAAKERLAAGLRAQQEADKERLKREEELAKIRLDTERRLADFREQSLQRAKDLEQQLSDQRLDLERSTAEARRRITAQQEDFRLEAERQRLRAAGLGTDALDTQARLNEATRRYTEQRIQIEQNATDRKVQVERTLADYQLTVARGISEILQDAGEKLADKMRKGGQAAAAAMTGAPMVGPGGIIARTGNTGQSTGAHLDARWADGRRITAADVDRYLMVNGRAPSSFGVTSGYGPRNLFGRSFHRGVDFGTPSGSGISLRGGASLLRDLGFTGAGGYAVEIMTPEGPMRLLHLQAGSAQRPVGSARRLIGNAGASVPGMAGITAAGQRLTAAVGANRAAEGQAALGDLVNSRQAEFSTITGQLEQQRRSVREQREDFQRMLELQRSGLSPELARQVAERERLARIEDASLQKLRDQLTLDLQGFNLTAQQRLDLEKILASTIMRQQALQGVVQGLNAEEQALDRLRQAYEQKRQLVEGIAGAIGNGIGQSIDLLIDGTENWGDSLRQIAAGVLKDIARQIAQTMVVAPIVKGITSAFGFADGGIMTAEGPVPLRKYAGGGIANSPQLALFGEGSMPEAYVPLPDGRRIPVAMKGGAGGATTVNVSVDASGSQVQGDAGRSEQLGRAVAQAVQAELVRQKRPGGLLAA
jgi:tape measure domain-containing protein